MDLNADSTTDDYFVTAVQIFDYCGVDSTATLRVDALMDKFAPFIKTNKSEYTYLKSLLDPEENNPEITVATLATTLNKYSENQKIKVDLDESFNLKSGQAPHDSDSGISTDGFQLLEDLQCELKEKAHLAQQLRSQLDFTDRQHEEALATITAERDSLRAHLNMLREENMTLSHVRRDYEDACDQLCHSERSLEEVKRELDINRKRARVLTEQVAMLESEKLTLQELLNKSKDECHRINEMYASRQSALLEENETLRTEHADVSTRLQDQEEFMQQIIKEKVLLEMELKDVFNKSNQAHQRFDRSFDISYTDDQMLTALDSLNAESRFSQDNRLLDEETFTKELKGEQGRPTNLSLYNEIRLSCIMSRQNDVEFNCSEIFDKSCQNTQLLATTSTQTDNINDIEPYVEEDKVEIIKSSIHIGIQTDFVNTEKQSCGNNNKVETCFACTKCLECEKLRIYATKLENDMNSNNMTVNEMRLEIEGYEDNLKILQNMIKDETNANKVLQTLVDGLQSNLDLLNAKYLQSDGSERETCSTQVQTECEYISVSTQVEVPCRDCERRKSDVQQKSLRRYFCM
ncbi:early endosome antigen 1-like isoform X2 [Battus philenor]|uniref:early endosome antigen 1-like isoform X2 n=1 Tax=Battus philenor TaxID=42288 RepID=UPI0035CF8415